MHSHVIKRFLLPNLFYLFMSSVNKLIQRDVLSRVILLSRSTDLMPTMLLVVFGTEIIQGYICFVGCKAEYVGVYFALYVVYESFDVIVFGAGFEELCYAYQDADVEDLVLFFVSFLSVN